MWHARDRPRPRRRPGHRRGRDNRLARRSADRGACACCDPPSGHRTPGPGRGSEDGQSASPMCASGTSSRRRDEMVEATRRPKRLLRTSPLSHRLPWSNLCASVTRCSVEPPRASSVTLWLLFIAALNERSQVQYWAADSAANNGRCNRGSLDHPVAGPDQGPSASDPRRSRAVPAGAFAVGAGQARRGSLASPRPWRSSRHDQMNSAPRGRRADHEVRELATVARITAWSGSRRWSGTRCIRTGCLRSACSRAERGVGARPGVPRCCRR